MTNYILYAFEYIVMIIIFLFISILWKSTGLFIITVLILLGILFFFRGWSQPHNLIINKQILYSPCDGTVKDIIDDGKNIRIMVFLNIHNIHVQYTPFKCIVKQMTYKNGEFNPAYILEKSMFNERLEYVLDNKEFGEIVFMQIAGQLARRIVPFVTVGDKLDGLQPLGLIKLGSRCDILIPKSNIQVLVRKNQRIYIGKPLVKKIS